MKIFIIRLGLISTITVFACIAATMSVIFLSRMDVDSCRLGADFNAVLVGDSHITWAFDDKQLVGVKNIAWNGEGYKYSYEKLVHLLNVEKGVKKVYLGFGYHSLSDYYDSYISGENSVYIFDRYLGVMTFEDYKNIILNNVKNIPAIIRKIVKERWRDALLKRCSLYGGFPTAPKTQIFEPDVMERRIKEQYYDGGNLRGISQSNFSYFMKIVELCRTQGVELTLIKTPVHSKYSELVPDYFKQKYSDLIFSNSLKYFDFPELQLGDNEFLPDGDHVNYDGATITTQRFKIYHESQ